MKRYQKINPSFREMKFQTEKMNAFNRVTYAVGPDELNGMDQDYTILYLHNETGIHGSATISRCCKMSTLESVWFDSQGSRHMLKFIDWGIGELRKRGDIGLFAHIGESAKTAHKLARRCGFKLIGTSDEKHGKFRRYFYLLEF